MPWVKLIFIQFKIKIKYSLLLFFGKFHPGRLKVDRSSLSFYKKYLLTQKYKSAIDCAIAENHQLWRSNNKIWRPQEWINLTQKDGGNF